MSHIYSSDCPDLNRDIMDWETDGGVVGPDEVSTVKDGEKTDGPANSTEDGDGSSQ
jgi:hypothetical protein